MNLSVDLTMPLGAAEKLVNFGWPLQVVRQFQSDGHVVIRVNRGVNAPETVEAEARRLTREEKIFLVIDV